jgi:hypothetical protein
VLSQLLSTNIKISDEDKCIDLLWSLSFDDVVSSLLSEEMRHKNMEGQSTYELFERGFS